MPHLIIEYSANLADDVDIDELVRAMHDAALGTGLASIDALRTRAVGRVHYAIGDRDPTNAFVAVTARLGAGLDGALGDARATTMLSVEYQEIDPARRVNRNHLRPLIAARTNHPTEEA